jgi:uncharacterized membrane protein YfcA
MHLQMLLVAAGAAFGGFAQGLSGFAFGLIALSIWVWVLDPTLIASLIVFGSLAAQFATAGILRQAWKPSLFLPFVVGGVLGVPLGVALLRWVDPLAFKIGVGVLLVLWCPTMLLMRDLPQIGWGGRVADGCVGWIGGIMGGLGGLTGPAPILWARLRGWDRHTQRAVFQTFNFCMQCLTAIAYASSGAVTHQFLLLLGVTVPTLLIASRLGNRLYFRISDQAFSRVILGLLSASGVVLIVSSLASLSQSLQR